MLNNISKTDNSQLIIENALIKEDEFILFVDKVKNDFIPSLDKRMPCNIHNYYNKIKNNAQTICAKLNNEIVGLLVFYSNDCIYNKAYITILAVHPNYRSIGIGSELLRNACEYARNNEKLIIAVDTNNKLARQCYLKQGFNVKMINVEELSGLTRYYMEKVL